MSLFKDVSVSVTQNLELKQLKKGGTWTKDVDTKEVNWYPLQKVNFARRKLEGVNPSAITRYDLRLLNIKQEINRIRAGGGS